MSKNAYMTLKNSDIIYTWATQPLSGWIVQQPNIESFYTICKENDITITKCAKNQTV